MKKQIAIFAAVIAALCMTLSCSDSPDSLSASKAESLVKKELKRLNQLEGAAYIQVGYFECNDNDTRYKYRQLAANDIVTYSCEKVMKTERVMKSRRVQRQSFWGTYTTTENYWENVEVPKYFVTIALTEKGQKLVYEEKEIEPTEDEKDLRLDYEIDLSKYPESSVDFAEFQEIEEQEEVEEVAEVEEAVAIDEIEEEVYEEVEAVEETTKPQTPRKTAYEIAKDKENVEAVKLKAFTLDIEKARNIIKTGDFTATAEILFEYDDVTPVGRVLLGVYEGQRFLQKNVHYAFYQDKGWKLEGLTSGYVEEAVTSM